MGTDDRVILVCFDELVQPFCAGGQELIDLGFTPEHLRMLFQILITAPEQTWCIAVDFDK